MADSVAGGQLRALVEMSGRCTDRLATVGGGAVVCGTRYDEHGACPRVDEHAPAFPFLDEAKLLAVSDVDWPAVQARAVERAARLAAARFDREGQHRRAQTCAALARKRRQDAELAEALLAPPVGGTVVYRGERSDG